MRLAYRSRGLVEKSSATKTAPEAKVNIEEDGDREEALVVKLRKVSVGRECDNVEFEVIRFGA